VPAAVKNERPEMKVLHVLDFSPPFPGALVDHLTALGRALQARGDALLVAFPRERSWLADFEGAAEVLVLPQIRRPMTSGFPGRLQKICRAREVDLLHLSFSSALPLALACFPISPRPAVLYHWHNLPPALVPPSSGRPPSWASRAARLSGLPARWAARRAIDLHLTVSQEIRGRLVAHGWARAERTIVLPSALPRLPEMPAPGSGFLLGAPGPVIGSVANFRPQRDHETLLRAFAIVRAAYPAARLVLVGDGSTRPAMEQLAVRLGLSSAVEFRGNLTDPAAAFRGFDLFAHAARYEGQGFVLLEALGHSLPIVATNLPAIREILRDGTDALLVPAGDAAAMGAGIKRALGTPDLLERLRGSGRARLQEDFAVGTWTARLLAIYDTLEKERAALHQRRP
jgi:glycosyltransferase involved in cell wall biosynthesis